MQATVNRRTKDHQFCTMIIMITSGLMLNYKEKLLLQVKTILAMEILQVILGVYAFVMCLWSSILCCIGKRCCTSTPVMAFQVACFILLPHILNYINYRYTTGS